jgi:hypothetical protein
MHRLLALGIALVLTTGCASSPRRGPEAALASSPRGDDSSPRGDDSERRIAIWSATIRGLIEGEGLSFDRIYVLDRADPDAAGPGRNEKRNRKQKPISAGVQAGIQDRLDDLPPVVFVSSGKDVLLDEDGCTHVRKNGALVTLGIIPDGDEKVEVETGMFIACLACTWLTYVVEHEGGEWKVTGTTGPIAVA